MQVNATDLHDPLVLPHGRTAAPGNRLVSVWMQVWDYSDERLELTSIATAIVDTKGRWSDCTDPTILYQIPRPGGPLDVGSPSVVCEIPENATADRIRFTMNRPWARDNTVTWRLRNS